MYRVRGCPAHTNRRELGAYSLGSSRKEALYDERYQSLCEGLCLFVHGVGPDIVPTPLPIGREWREASALLWER